ncbi:MAG: class I SAM-dependent methyltransferase [Nitrospinae bacterium]|nr:class I SAM-dependent methyltransferase [Nitrospinota bacterium]
MALRRSGVKLWFDLKTKVPLTGTICQLGRQTVDVSRGQVKIIAKQFGLSLPIIDSVQNDDKSQPASAMNDVMLFKSLGFDSVSSVDLVEADDPTHVFDLNEPAPEALREKFDCVFDGGTAEHVFNVPQLLRNMHFMLKPGGIIVHASPSSNHVDHGFHMFSPTFFYDYYTVNKYEVLQSYLFEYDPHKKFRPWNVYNYSPGSIDDLSIGGWDGVDALGIWFVARKKENSSSNVVPVQSFYLRQWSQDNAAGAPVAEAPAATPGLLRKTIMGLAKKILKNDSATYNHVRDFYLYVKEMVLKAPFRRRPHRPPVIARY